MLDRRGDGTGCGARGNGSGGNSDTGHRHDTATQHGVYARRGTPARRADKVALQRVPVPPQPPVPSPLQIPHHSHRQQWHRVLPAWLGGGGGSGAARTTWPAALPVGVALRLRPRLPPERLVRVTLLSAADEQLYRIDSERGTVRVALHEEQTKPAHGAQWTRPDTLHAGDTEYVFDGALLCGDDESAADLYYDAAFRNRTGSVGGGGGGGGTTAVWSLQDAVAAVATGVSNLVVFAYGGECTGKTTTLYELLQLSLRDFGASGITHLRTLSCRRIGDDDNDNNNNRSSNHHGSENMDNNARRRRSRLRLTAVALDDVPGIVERQQGYAMHTGHRDVSTANAAGARASFVVTLHTAHGTSLRFADLAGSSRVTPTGVKTRGDIGVFTLEQAVLHERNAHMPRSALTRALAAGIGGSAIGVGVCCIGPTRFHARENARTIAFARRLMDVENCVSLEHGGASGDSSDDGDDGGDGSDDVDGDCHEADRARAPETDGDGPRNVGDADDGGGGGGGGGDAGSAGGRRGRADREQDAHADQRRDGAGAARDATRAGTRDTGGGDVERERVRTCSVRGGGARHQHEATAVAGATHAGGNNDGDANGYNRWARGSHDDDDDDNDDSDTNGHNNAGDHADSEQRHRSDHQCNTSDEPRAAAAAGSARRQLWPASPQSLSSSPSWSSWLSERVPSMSVPAYSMMDGRRLERGGSEEGGAAGASPVRGHREYARHNGRRRDADSARPRDAE